MAATDNMLMADPAEIRRDLSFMTAGWADLSNRAMFEVRAFKEDCQPQTAKFAVDWIDDAVGWTADLNRRGYNLYAVRNPIRDTFTGSAKDTDIIAACYLWADCDTEGATGNVHRFDGPKWTAAVVTGTMPSVRVHTYWRLEQPCTDLAEWRQMQMDIAAHFGSDKSVINPSRIMRIGGTISFPDRKKAAKGYVQECTQLRTEYAEPRPPVTMDQMRRVFAAARPQMELTTSAAPQQSISAFQIDIAAVQQLDRERATIQALGGTEWHNAVIRLVASYVARGLSDNEIHALTQPLTLAGYTAEQTGREVQTAIDGARRKGFAPEPATAFTPNFDHAPAPTVSDTDPVALPWRVQRADEFTADFVAPEYLIDGIVQRGRVYTLTAPTGTGKTAVMLYIATAIATGQTVCEREVEHGDVLFLAGENPDDVRARVIATMEFYGINPSSCRLHFIAGTFRIRADLDRLREEAAKLPNLLLIVIDTFAAYFDGDDENSNAQALDFARVVRKLASFQSRPAIVMPAHPVKNATKGNLSPKGGSSLLNEVDGNLTLWNEGGIITMHWQGKFRGAEFDPLMLELQRFETSAICDNQGRIMPTILAKPLLRIRAMELARANLSNEDKLLLSIRDEPEISMAQRGVNIGLHHRQQIKRAIDKMAQQKLIRLFRTNWELTKEGERAVAILDGGGKFVPETDL